MSGIRDKLKKAAGLFVEFDGTQDGVGDLDPPVVQPAPPRTIEQIVKEAPGPSLDEVKAEPEPQAPVFRTDGSVDFNAIYQLAKLTPAAFGAEQVLQILSEFPAELPLAARRATMKVTLGAMAQTTGATTESVVADTSRKLAALASYSEGFEKQATEFAAKAEAEIVRLQAEIDKNKARIEDAKQQAAKVAAACSAESDRLDDVLEFFSMDVPPSNLAPKA